MIDFFVEIFIVVYNLLFQNLGLTIIFIGILSKVILWPLTNANLRHTKRMQDIKPQLDQLKATHGSDRQKLTAEQMRLFKEQGINPAAGCLPLIVQLVLLIFLYQVVSQLITRGLNTSFLGFDLAKPDVFHIEGIPFALPGVLVLLAAVTSLIQAKMMLPEPIKVNKDDKPKEKAQKEDMADAMVSVQGQMVFLSPLLIAYAGTTFPAGLALYWVVTTVLAIVQQYITTGLGGLRGWLKKLNLVK
jgi:YidC/Oxa1 family membrane protein insertase